MKKPFFLFFMASLVLTSAPPVPNAADRIEYETGFYYTIQKGDTLSTISERFFDTPRRWPDLWKENSQITNPHRLNPGDRIRLFHDITVAESAIAPLETPGLIQPKEGPYFLFGPIERIGFIQEAPVPPIGVIFQVQDDKALISAGDRVYIRKADNRVFIPGTRLTAYRTFHLGKDIRTTTYPGFQHYLTGVVEIVRDEDRYAVGQVVRSYRSIEVNDGLMPFEERSPKISLQESRKGLDGAIIGSEEHMLIFAGHSVAFIDKGSRDGVAPGQIYRIYLEEKARLASQDSASTSLKPLDYGRIIVLHVEEKTSTVLIIQADESVTHGTRFHGELHSLPSPP